jgi:hypothetical protein
MQAINALSDFLEVDSGFIQNRKEPVWVPFFMQGYIQYYLYFYVRFNLA